MSLWVWLTMHLIRFDFSTCAFPPQRTTTCRGFACLTEAFISIWGRCTLPKVPCLLIVVFFIPLSREFFINLSTVERLAETWKLLWHGNPLQWSLVTFIYLYPFVKATIVYTYRRKSLLPALIGTRWIKKTKQNKKPRIETCKLFCEWLHTLKSIFVFWPELKHKCGAQSLVHFLSVNVAVKSLMEKDPVCPDKLRRVREPCLCVIRVSLCLDKEACSPHLMMMMMSFRGLHSGE